MIRFANPPELSAPAAPYGHQAEVGGDVRWLVLSGQLGQAADGTLPSDVAGQLELALANVSLSLAAAGMGVEDVVQLRTYVVGPSDPVQRGAVFRAWLGDHRPCMTLVQVAGLAAPQFLVEVEALACQDGESAG